MTKAGLQGLVLLGVQRLVLLVLQLSMKTTLTAYLCTELNPYLSTSVANMCMHCSLPRSRGHVEAYKLQCPSAYLCNICYLHVMFSQQSPDVWEGHTGCKWNCFVRPMLRQTWREGQYGMHGVADSTASCELGTGRQTPL